MNADVLKLLGSAVGRAQLAQPNAGAPRSSGTPPELARSSQLSRFANLSATVN